MFNDNKTDKISRIIRTRHHGSIHDLLVVGCGSGTEAAILAHELDASVTGIDDGSQLGLKFDHDATSKATLLEQDARNMTFADESFDFIYSFHALEHIPEYENALGEMRRVLKSNGGFFIGTPNKSRIIAYLGSKPGTLTWKQKVYLNYMDWRARLRGQFRNECGAHAGFTKKELYNILSGHFAHVEDVTLTYYLELYHRYRFIVRVIDATGLGSLLFPSVYFMGTKDHEKPCSTK